MYSFLKKVAAAGTFDGQSMTDRQSIVVTNYYALSIFALGFTIGSAMLGYYGKVLLSSFLYGATIVSLLPLVLNHFQYYSASRLLLCAEIVVSVFCISISTKSLFGASITPSNYFDSRFFLVASVIIPITTFRMAEKGLLLAGIAFSFFGLVLFDPLHNWLNIGYYDLVPATRDYYFIANFYPLMAYTFIVTGFIFIKSQQEKTERQNEALITQLSDTNLVLHEQHEEIETQNLEIKTQTEELLTNQEQLVEAMQIIELQKTQLHGLNKDLETELTNKNQQLQVANQELTKYNNELRQFSYTISHNLRGPIARLLGLTDLMIKDDRHLSESQMQLVSMIRQSAMEFDGIIKDLNKIIDIRNEIYKIREKVYFQDEWDIVNTSLLSFVTPDMKIQSDFQQAPIIYTVKPIVQSILYNLANNAMKYRSPERPLRLNVSTSIVNDEIVLQVADNGLGINLALFENDLFKLYRRFHSHTEGKGMGLYLVKSQIEAIGGSIRVESELDKGTTFYVHMPIPPAIEEQLVFDAEYGSIFYNAELNCAGIVWKKQVTSEQYRTLFNQCLNIVKMYHTPYWVSDLRLQGVVAVEDQRWMLQTIYPEANRNGLVQTAIIYNPHSYSPEYPERIRAAADHLGIKIQFFDNRKEADEWIQMSFETTTVR
jgi:signal transduction histidine kinase